MGNTLGVHIQGFLPYDLGGSRQDLLTQIGIIHTPCSTLHLTWGTQKGIPLANKGTLTMYAFSLTGADTIGTRFLQDFVDNVLACHGAEIHKALYRDEDNGSGWYRIEPTIPGDLKKYEAQDKAHELWGFSYHCEKDRDGRYHVGTLDQDSQWVKYGSGASWKAAFNDAEARGATAQSHKTQTIKVTTYPSTGPVTSEACITEKPASTQPVGGYDLGVIEAEIAKRVAARKEMFL